MASGSNPPPGRLAPGLRMATWNVNGLCPSSPLRRERIHAFVREWISLRLSIICVQETHLTPRTASTVEALLHAATTDIHAPPFTAFWAHHHRSQAGVGILINSALLANGVVQLLPAAAPDVRTDGDGRLLALHLKWGGHNFWLANAYLPSGNPTAQRAFISEQLEPLAKAANGRVILAGDMNFTLDVALDRVIARAGVGRVLESAPGLVDGLARGGGPSSGDAVAPDVVREGGRVAGEPCTGARAVPLAEAAAADASQPGPSAHPDTSVARHFHATLPGLVCAFRALHPTRRSFTFHRAHSASRLDYFFVPPTLVPFLFHCQPAPSSLSDHLPVILHLRPCVPSEIGPGARRVRMYFSKHDSLRTAFSTWLAEQTALAPLHSDSALLAWWPGFKRALAVQVSALNRQAATLQRALVASSVAAQHALSTALAQVESGDPTALPAVIAARRELASASCSLFSESSSAAHQSWLHTQERPSPILSKLLRPPPSSRQVPALRCPSGGLLTGRQLPAQVARHFAKVSHPSPTDPIAQAQVLGALAASGLRLPPESTEALGSPLISPADCLAALQRCPPGRSPGPDGIPMELYRSFRAALAPLLSAVLTAIGRLETLPTGFTQGLLIVLFKKGDPLDVANYRPITLLNTDYRLLAKILVARLAPPLAKTITPEQTAFLPGRHIGENILLLQLLPSYLQAHDQSAALAFLDFAKAYDTLDRSFLFACMETMGVGAGFLRWTRLLLSDTRMRAVVNGFLSRLVATLAGVRQGCPAAPDLYLFPAQALQCWLHHQGFGIPIAGRRRTCSQFADDTVAFLRNLSPEHVSEFLQAMAVFARASGQHLNIGKCQLLPIGRHVPCCTLPSIVCSIPVVVAATTLGLSFTNSPPQEPPSPPHLSDAWTARLATVQGAYTKLSKLSLSTFGRGFASAAYGISTLLYHAEFAGLPEAAAATLDGLTKKLVDRGLNPSSLKRVPPGISSSFLPGHPRLGGFGCLPWRQHIISRHAVWGAKLVCALAAGLTDRTPLWIVVAHELLSFQGRKCFPCLPSSTAPVVHPALALLSASYDTGPLPRIAGSLPCALPAGPLRRLAAGMCALRCAAGDPQDVAATPLEASSWGPMLPLWGNPFLSRHLVGSGPEVRGPGFLLEHRFGKLQAIPTLLTVGDAHRLHGALQAALSTCQGASLGARVRACKLQVWLPEMRRLGCPAWPIATGSFGLLASTPNDLCFDLGQLCSFLPSWSVPTSLAVPQPCTAMEPLASLPPTPVLRALVSPHAPPPSVSVLPAPLPLGSPPPAAAPVSLAPSPSAPVLPACHAPGASSGPVEASALERAAVRAAVYRLGWPLPPASPGGPLRIVRLSKLTVATATTLQLGPHAAAREAAHAAYVEAAAGPAPHLIPVPSLIASFRRTLGMAWQLPWENRHKEILWRLAVDGVPGVRALPGQPWTCPCRTGPVPSPRAHAFWECTVAQAVRRELTQTIGAFGLGPVRQTSLWLCQPPGPSIHGGVWLVVCLAALAAMDHGRRQLWRLHRGAAEAAEVASASGGRQRTLPELWGASPPPGAPIRVRAAALAVADFWGRLAHYAHSSAAPPAWALDVPSSHPFLSHGGLHLSLPAHLAREAPTVAAAGPPSSEGPPSPPRPSLRQRRLAECWALSPSLPSPASATFEAAVAPIAEDLAGLGWDSAD